MKKIPDASIIFFFLLLIIISQTSARLLPSNPGDISQINPKQEDDFSMLMGLEECGDKYETCQKRRMVAEAHLDYIYTQQQKP
ncbi:hypothetical protein ACJIZ3_021831 [Penstemon smallii]|uniref:Phytosulfokine n=1 Tax=Penstemon smallii TaxID=265156 RepID=A0ABD3SNF4_9LAMI